MRTRSTLICSFSALFCASSSSTSSFRLSLSSESSVSGGIPNLNQPRMMRSMPKARVKPTQRGEQLRGNGWAGGGGGAGGLVYSASYPISGKAYTVTIGAGGAGVLSNNNG